ncbi:hypothetical protein QCE73_36455 [Caballeronia sp. LZ029]|uniref:hypothetical protein n=1 Tax=Caballeronia sp. LZ029 TaxID=3038564 RepID=UPI002856A979|nr:hypothetical protein [Caballeronia sp. LZ029]MDR5748687.1 hypothetical protein [Caballeronia sp. LZ029]
MTALRKEVAAQVAPNIAPTADATAIDPADFDNLGKGAAGAAVQNLNLMLAQ